MFDTKTAYQTGASKLSDCVLLTFPKNMHSTETSDADGIVRASRCLIALICSDLIAVSCKETVPLQMIA